MGSWFCAWIACFSGISLGVALLCWWLLYPVPLVPGVSDDSLLRWAWWVGECLMGTVLLGIEFLNQLILSWPQGPSLLLDWLESGLMSSGVFQRTWEVLGCVFFSSDFFFLELLKNLMVCVHLYLCFLLRVLLVGRWSVGCVGWLGCDGGDTGGTYSGLGRRLCWGF